MEEEPAGLNLSLDDLIKKQTRDIEGERRQRRQQRQNDYPQGRGGGGGGPMRHTGRGGGGGGRESHYVSNSGMETFLWNNLSTCSVLLIFSFPICSTKKVVITNIVVMLPPIIDPKRDKLTIGNYSDALLKMMVLW